jgi:hypothetical protein
MDTGPLAHAGYEIFFDSIREHIGESRGLGALLVADDGGLIVPGPNLVLACARVIFWLEYGLAPLWGPGGIEGRTVMLTRPRYVIAVPDLACSAAFYRDVLGFAVREVGDPGFHNVSTVGSVRATLP